MKHTEKKEFSVSNALLAAASSLYLIILILATSTENVVVQGFAAPPPKTRSSSLLPRTFTSHRNDRSCLHPSKSIILSASVSLGDSGDARTEYHSTPVVVIDKDKNANKQIIMTQRQQHQRQVLVIIAALVVVMGSSTTIWMKRQAILTFISFVKNECLIQALNRFNAAGPLGLVTYTILFLIWEMTFGMTTPVEVAAGMAFGAVPAIIANGIAKTGGAFLTFYLARNVFADVIYEKYIQNNELLMLMQESIQETPFRVALLCRFSPLPEFIKNAGMGVMKSGMSKRCFLASVLVHGFSFTCLWSCMGAESARVMIHGQPPSMLLKYLLTGATWIGFGAPVLIGVWIKSLKDKQKRRLQQRQGLDDDEQQEDSSSIAVSSASSSS